MKTVYFRPATKLEDADPDNQNDTMLYVDDTVMNGEIEEMFNDLALTISCNKEELNWMEDVCAKDPMQFRVTEPLDDDTQSNDEIEKMYREWELALNFNMEEFNQIVGRWHDHPNETLLAQSMNVASNNNEMDRAFS